MSAHLLIIIDASENPSRLTALDAAVTYIPVTDTAETDATR